MRSSKLANVVPFAALLGAAAIIPSATPQGAGPQTYSVGWGTYNPQTYETELYSYIVLNENEMGDYIDFIVENRAAQSNGSYPVVPGSIYTWFKLYHGDTGEPTYYYLSFATYYAGYNRATQYVRLEEPALDDWIAMLQDALETHEGDTIWITVGEFAAGVGVYASNVAH